MKREIIGFLVDGFFIGCIIYVLLQAAFHQFKGLGNRKSITAVPKMPNPPPPPLEDSVFKANHFDRATHSNVWQFKGNVVYVKTSEEPGNFKGMSDNPIEEAKEREHHEKIAKGSKITYPSKKPKV